MGGNRCLGLLLLLFYYCGVAASAFSFSLGAPIPPNPGSFTNNVQLPTENVVDTAVQTDELQSSSMSVSPSFQSSTGTSTSSQSETSSSSQSETSSSSQSETSSSSHPSGLPKVTVGVHKSFRSIKTDEVGTFDVGVDVVYSHTEDANETACQQKCREDVDCVVAVLCTVKIEAVTAAPCMPGDTSCKVQPNQEKGSIEYLCHLYTKGTPGQKPDPLGESCRYVTYHPKCRNLPQVTDATSSHETFSSDGSIHQSYKCHEGFEPTGILVSTCDKTGEIAPTNQTCKPEETNEADGSQEGSQQGSPGGALPELTNVIPKGNNFQLPLPTGTGGISGQSNVPLPEAGGQISTTDETEETSTTDETEETSTTDETEETSTTDETEETSTTDETEETSTTDETEETNTTDETDETSTTDETEETSTTDETEETSTTDETEETSTTDETEETSTTDETEETTTTDETEETSTTDETEETSTTDETEETSTTDETEETSTTDETEETSTTDETEETSTTDETEETSVTDETEETSTTDETDETSTTDETEETSTTDETEETSTTDETEETSTTDETEKTSTTDETEETSTTDETEETSTTDETEETSTTDETDETSTTDETEETSTTDETGGEVEVGPLALCPPRTIYPYDQADAYKMNYYSEIQCFHDEGAPGESSTFACSKSSTLWSSKVPEPVSMTKDQYLDKGCGHLCGEWGSVFSSKYLPYYNWYAYYIEMTCYYYSYYYYNPYDPQMEWFTYWYQIFPLWWGNAAFYEKWEDYLYYFYLNRFGYTHYFDYGASSSTGLVQQVVDVVVDQFSSWFG